MSALRSFQTAQRSSLLAKRVFGNARTYATAEPVCIKLFFFLKFPLIVAITNSFL